MLAIPAAAQSTTEDGIRAMLRGDYQAAARILRPLAEDAVRPDPVARFFLAFLYDTGRGVQFDQGRACGLFLGAATRPNPFMEQSSAIATVMQDLLGGAGSPFCVTDESWYGEPPQSFVLGPGHRIVFADTSITLDYGDKGWRTPLRMETGAVPITSETRLVVVNGPTRPASYDVTSVVGLRVNANGEAEFTIMAGSSPRTEVIQWKGSR
jgi:hypothetical protein